MEMNELASAAAASLVKDFFSSVINTVSSPIKKNITKITTDFEDFLAICYKKNKFVRILSNKATPLNIDGIYVSGQFRCGDEVFSDQEVMQRVRDGEKIIIKGDGGLGKTFFVKKLWGAIFENREGKIPIFLSLRDLNELSDIKISPFIRQTIMSNKEYSEDTFDYFCKTGSFIFIFDGFDEVVEAKRIELQTELMAFSSLYDKCGYIISSRETDGFNAWDTFFEYRVVRFDRQRTLALIENIPFEAAPKKKFIKNITPEYFDQNESFLSNPLLAIMMLVTFRDNAKIPSKMSMFYENAFQTLYSLHDGLKGAFLRERKLDKDSFRRLFSVFCLFSYYDEFTKFNDEEIRGYIAKSIKYLGLEVSVNEVLKEFVESTNLLQLEGMEYSFIHRSFQEYFAAYCATKIVTSKTKELLEVFYGREFDETFKLANEIHPDLVAKELIILLGEKLKKDGNFPLTKSNKKYPYFFLNKSGVELRLVMYLYYDKASGKVRTRSYQYRMTENEVFSYISTFCEIYDDRAALHKLYASIHKNLRLLNQISESFVDSAIPHNDLLERLKDKNTLGMQSVTFNFSDDQIHFSSDHVASYDQGELDKILKKLKPIACEINIDFKLYIN